MGSFASPLKQELWYMLVDPHGMQCKLHFYLFCRPFSGQAGKEHEELCSGISLLEKGSKFHTKFDTSIAETLYLFEDDSVQESFRGNLRI